MRKALFSLALLGTLLLATGCSGKLYDWVDEDALTARAHTIVEQMNNREYEAILADMAAEVSVADMAAEVDPLLEEYGALQSIRQEHVACEEVNGEEYAIVYVQTQQENTRVIYTIFFAQDGSTAGVRLAPSR